VQSLVLWSWQWLPWSTAYESCTLVVLECVLLIHRIPFRWTPASRRHRERQLYTAEVLIYRPKLVLKSHRKTVAPPQIVMEPCLIAELSVWYSKLPAKEKKERGKGCLLVKCQCYNRVNRYGTKNLAAPIIRQFCELWAYSAETMDRANISRYTWMLSFLSCTLLYTVAVNEWCAFNLEAIFLSHWSGVDRYWLVHGQHLRSTNDQIWKSYSEQ
jgi:hypothetical protein